MAQYDDFSNPPPRPRSPGEPSLPMTSGNGGTTGAGRGPESTDNEEWRYRPSSTSRRRNQWRQYKHMTPDFGSASSAPTAPAPQASAPQAPTAPAANGRPAALPSFSVRGHAGGGDRPPQGPLRPSGPQAAPSNPVGQGPASGTPVQSSQVSGAQTTRPRSPSLHPHSVAVGSEPAGTVAAPNRAAAAPGTARASTPSNVTPLRSRESRRRSATGAAAMMGLGALAKPTQSDRPTPRTRRFSPQRRLAKLPRPALYAIRLAILGVGVAAIAGTLLSVFSPSNVTSNGGTETVAAASRGANPSPGQGAVTIADIQPTSELTRLKAQLDQLATLTPGLTPAVYAFDIDSGRYVDLGGTQAVAAASTIKVPILVAFLQQVDAGNLALNQALVLQEQHLAGGSGTLANEAIGSEYTALEVATRMIINSDNTATNMMIEALGGQEALNQQFATWGLESTVLRNLLPDLEGTNTTSTRDLALLMALVDQGDVLSRRSRERLLSIMQRTVNRSLIAFSLTDGSLVANKTGDIALALGDVALVDTPNGNRYVLAIMVQRPNNDGRASELIRRITETVHKELNQPIVPVGGPLESGEAAPAEDVTDPGEASPPADGMAPENTLDSEGSAAPETEVGRPEEAAPPSEATPEGTPSGDQIPPG